jgi:uncharacterized protein
MPHSGLVGIQTLVDATNAKQSPDQVARGQLTHKTCNQRESTTGHGPVQWKSVGNVDDIVEQILTTFDTITVVGASSAPAKDAHAVPLHMQRHGWRIIPVNPHATTILDEPVYRRLSDVPEQVGLVDVFRPSAETADVARQAVAAGATALWLQLGIASDEARAIAEDAGMLYVEDRCLIIEQRRLALEAPTRP